jgi:protein O-GlcNAc transferase
MQSQPPSSDEALQRATELHLQGKLSDAERLYGAVLIAQPLNFVALHRLSVISLQQAQYEQALQRVEAALAVDPSSEPALMNKGTALLALGRNGEAIAAYKAAAEGNPESADAHFNLGNALMAAGRNSEAAASFLLSLSLRPGDVETLRRQAVALSRLGRTHDALSAIERARELVPMSAELCHEQAGMLVELERYSEAVQIYDRALLLDAQDTVALNNRGLALIRGARPLDAVASFDRAIEIHPGDPVLWYNRGTALRAIGSVEDAFASYDRALSLNPDHAPTLVDRGNLLQGLRRYEEALDCFNQAAQILPSDPTVFTNMGNALRGLRRCEEALAAHERALAIDANLVEPLINRGIALKDLNRTEEAIASYERALAIEPDHPDALYNCGLAHSTLNRHEQALPYYERALEANSGHRYALGMLADASLHICNWNVTEGIAKRLETHIRDSLSVITPFTVLGYLDEPSLQLACSKAYVEDALPDVPRPASHSPSHTPQRLRIAYLSSDFQRHSMSFSIAEIFELHDRSRFEVTGVSWGADDGSPVRARIRNACDRFLDARSIGDRDLARQLVERGTAIAIDLKGLTGNNRLGIYAQRPAPIQVGYFGYPATVGSSFIDYVLADPIIVPLAQQPNWAEHIVNLPGCYWPNDRQRAVPTPTFTRVDLGLPDRGFVFCCFNNSWKITPPLFDIWMRLLRDCSGSVLWLLEDSEAAKANLLREAGARGVDAERLVFAARAEPEVHLARHRFADLFLDTLPCNAHTTASDALWMAVPVVTCPGKSFAARVAGSLLHAVDLPQLVCPDLEAYEATARRLTAHPAELRNMKAKLEASRFDCMLFDSKRLCRNIEAAYLEMWEIYRRGEAPRGFAVAESAAR